MKRLALIATTLLFSLGVNAHCEACKKCGRAHGANYVASAGVMTVAPMAYTTSYEATSVLSYAPASYVSVAPTNYVSVAPTSTMTFAPASAQFSSPQYFTAPLSTSNFVYANPASYSQQSTVQPQFFGVGDLIGGARGIGCALCRDLGCCNGSGGDSDDPVKSIRNAVDGIKETIRDIKELRDLLKDLDTAASSSSETPTSEVNLARLRQLKDEIQTIVEAENAGKSVRLAQKPQ